MWKSAAKWSSASGAWAVLLALAAVTGCPQREVAVIDPDQAKESEKEIPVEINRDIDILFVIDNSGSMEEEQASLAANFSRFISVLQTIEGGLPNVHIGVVSTDIGAGPFGNPGCSGNGDNGTLQAEAQGGCTPPNGNFISDVADEAGGRVTNYSGTLEETFSCIAQLGTSGCGFEQPLESMRRALNGSNPENQGFLRESAFLAVIIITDEDDCSAEDTRMFDNMQDGLDSELGPFDSYRCFEFGVVCEPDSRTQVGPRMNCEPRPDSQYMYEVQEYVDFLKELKQDPNLLITAGIFGNPTPVEVGVGDDGEPTLEPSCVSASGEADPGVRLEAFFDQFPGRNTTTTICNEDLSDALTQIAELLREVVGNPCLEGPLRLGDDGQPLCTVEDVRSPDTDREERSIVPECSDPASATSEAPCWYAETDTENCSDTDTQLALTVERGDTSVPTGTFVEVHCELE